MQKTSFVFRLKHVLRKKEILFNEQTDLMAILFYYVIQTLLNQNMFKKRRKPIKKINFNLIS